MAHRRLAGVFWRSPPFARVESLERMAAVVSCSDRKKQHERSVASCAGRSSHPGAAVLLEGELSVGLSPSKPGLHACHCLPVDGKAMRCHATRQRRTARTRADSARTLTPWSACRANTGFFVRVELAKKWSKRSKTEAAWAGHGQGMGRAATSGMARQGPQRCSRVAVAQGKGGSVSGSCVRASRAPRSGFPRISP